ncbi:hypothetical protein I3843_04G164900 [Carya illinoinensis]|nr:hypothetical protein I3843_04G164900 [Carya illinoinensis]
MKTIRDWVFSQLVSMSLVSSTPLSGNDSFFSEGLLEEESDDQGLGHTANLLALPLLPDASHTSDGNQDNLLVAKVLYRIHLAAMIRAGESNLNRKAGGLPELDFLFRILVLGKTGVGKSSTINSIFDQTKTITDAFQPDTDCIQEVRGIVNGIRISVIDNPGFLPYSSSNSPPDIVLYSERLDVINMGYSDFPLFKLMTQVFGIAIWFNTILVMTHASSALPEGPSGYPVNYESYVTQCTDLVQHHIHQAMSDSRLENPVLLAENHPHYKTNFMVENVLPNGQVWKSQFLLLCICTKVLGDVNSLLKFQGSIELGPLSTTRLPSLPHILSSLLRRHSMSVPNGLEDQIDESFLLDISEEDEYDQLPPIRILKKSQFDTLTDSQKIDYLDELDYREILYLKKQLKEEYRKRMENRLSKEENLVNHNDFDSQQVPSKAVALPDMAIPPRMDHDVGFDGINLETVVEINMNVFASVRGQMSKDKEDFSIQMEFVTAYTDPSGPTYCVGLDVQPSGKDMIYTVHSNAKLRSLKHNIADCGLSLMTLEKKYYVGTKLEDTIAVRKRLKFVVNAGRMGCPRQVANGASFKATLRGSEYLASNDNLNITMSVLSFNKEIVLGAGLHCEFRPSRSLRVSVNANLNSRKMGQVCIKTSSSEHLQIALVAAFTVFKAMLRRKTAESRREALESG